ncbi:MAG: DNA-directed RNA polymerase subunit omega [bacterium]
MDVSKEECANPVGNNYVLALVAAKRARQLNSIARDKNIHQLKELALIETASNKAGEIALEEISAGKISYHL